MGDDVIGAKVRVRGQEGVIARKINEGQYVIRLFNVTGDVRPKPGQEIVSPEITAFVGEIEIL